MKKKQVEKEQNNEKQLPRQETTLGEDIFQLLLKIVLIILAVILVFTFMYGMARINDVSMKPAIKDGDLVMYYRLDKRFVSGDIAVFKKDGRTTTGRAVAVAGDTVDITKDGLMINGATQISQDIILTPHSFKMELTFQSLLEKVRYLYWVITDRKRQTAESMAVLILKTSKEKRLRLFGPEDSNTLLR